MPFHVAVEIKDTGRYGMGLYAAQDIPAGTKIWSFATNATDEVVQPRGYAPSENRVWTKESLLAVQDEEEIKRILWGGYIHVPTGIFLELRDGSQYTNHSNEPNQGGPWSVQPSEEMCIVIKDVKEGEELTDHYGVFHDSKAGWVHELMEKYCPMRHEFEESQVENLDGTLEVLKNN